MPLSQPDAYHGFWETIRCGGDFGTLVIIPTCQERWSNTCVSLPGGGQHSAFRLGAGCLYHEKFFHLCRWFNQFPVLHFLGRHVANHKGGSSRTEESLKYSKPEIIKKKPILLRFLSLPACLLLEDPKDHSEDLTWHPAPPELKGWREFIRSLFLHQITDQGAEGHWWHHHNTARLGDKAL